MADVGLCETECIISPAPDSNVTLIKQNSSMRIEAHRNTDNPEPLKDVYRNSKFNNPISPENTLKPEHSTRVYPNEIYISRYSSLKQITKTLQCPLVNHEKESSSCNDKTESSNHTSSVTSSFNNVQTVTAELPISTSNAITSDNSSPVQKCVKLQNASRNTDVVLTKCLLKNAVSSESSSEFLSSDPDNVVVRTKTVTSSGPKYSHYSSKTRQIPEQIETSSKTSKVPTIVIDDREIDQTSIYTEDYKRQEQVDHSRLYPLDTERVSVEKSTELQRSSRCESSIFTFDNVIAESQQTATEGSVLPPARKFKPVSTHTASTFSEEANVSDLVRLKAMTASLNLTTRRKSYVAWKEEYLDKPLLARYRPQVTDAGNGEWSTERKVEINNAIAWVKRELIEMKKNDQELARILVSLRHEIRQMKLQKTCSEHREMLDDVEDKMAERGQMSELCDLPTEPMSPEPLKNVGVTRMNISSRRFSVF